MASNTAGLTNKPSYFEKPFAVTGYSGYVRDVRDKPTPVDAFPGLPVGGGAPAPMTNLLSSFQEEKRKHLQCTQAAGYRIPGYAGHCSGHQHVCGFTHGAVCWGEAGRTDYAAVGEGAPGLTAGPQIIKNINLQKGAPLPDGAPRTKMGYTGHLPGRHYSTNYGASFNSTAGKLLVNPDVAVPLTIGEFRDERPPRLQAAVAGYKGFRPRATPL
jgi:hypothetical protein